MNRDASTDPGVLWLLGSEDHSVRYLTLTDVLSRAEDDPEVVAARDAIPSGANVTALQSGQDMVPTR